MQYRFAVNFGTLSRYVSCNMQLNWFIHDAWLDAKDHTYTESIQGGGLGATNIDFLKEGEKGKIDYRNRK